MKDWWELRSLHVFFLRVSYEWTLPAITVQPSLSVNVDHEINIVSVCEILTDKYPATHRLASVAFWKLRHVQGVFPSAVWPNQREHDTLWCPPGQHFCWSLQSGCRRMALHMHSLPEFKDLSHARAACRTHWYHIRWPIRPHRFHHLQDDPA